MILHGWFTPTSRRSSSLCRPPSHPTQPGAERSELAQRQYGPQIGQGTKVMEIVVKRTQRERLCRLCKISSRGFLCIYFFPFNPCTLLAWGCHLSWGYILLLGKKRNPGWDQGGKGWVSLLRSLPCQKRSCDSHVSRPHHQRLLWQGNVKPWLQLTIKWIFVLREKEPSIERNRVGFQHFKIRVKHLQLDNNAYFTIFYAEAQRS